MRLEFHDGMALPNNNILDCNAAHPHSDEMAFSSRLHSKGRIDRAGKQLITLPREHEELPDELAVINNWRSCHGFPLQIIKMTLLKRAKKFDGNALVAQRLKRLQSISLKLQHNPNMKLSQMQDIGGCRAVLKTVREVDRLVDYYERSRSKNRHDRPALVDKDDYISSPKCDGYRSVHVIYRYQSNAADRTVYNGQKVEIQIRSALQHAWATAVEVCQTFTGQALKSKVKDANESWLRFFALMGSAIAKRERRPLVPNTPTSTEELVAELRQIVRKENIIESIKSWGGAVHHLTLSQTPEAHTYLLVLDSRELTLKARSFGKKELLIAQDEYLREEKRTGDDPRQQVVLVSVDSLSALRKAYPNFYLDTGAFISAVHRAIRGGDD